MILVTGGAGFIGGNFVIDWLANQNASGVVNLDKLTYAGNLTTLKSLFSDSRHIFVKGDIGNYDLVLALLQKYRISAVVNFAAESHVDRSIDCPTHFIATNVVGTFHLLEATRAYWSNLSSSEKVKFRFLQISTDEVYGSLTLTETPFTEANAYKPNSPYSASKAAADHLVRAWHHTYGLPVITTNCSNNYGPYQLPEKLIPMVIQNALAGKPLPIYGDGKQIRDWLFVADHCAAIRRILEVGKLGETYNIGGWNERSNLDVVNTICNLLNQLRPKPDGSSYASQITYVKDRPGHDRRYAINATKLKSDLGWSPIQTFDTGIHKTIQWYLDNQEWAGSVLSPPISEGNISKK